MMENAGNELQASNVLDFLLICGRLKATKRTGWVNNKVVLPESVSDHMYRMAIISFLITDPLANRDRAIKIALVHDLAEALVGDITPFDGIKKEEKHKLEEQAMSDIRVTLQGSVVGEEIYQLWLEYEKGETREAQLLKDIDKFEMILQAFEYEGSHKGMNLQQFFDSTRGKFKTQLVKGWTYELEKRRGEQSKSTHL